MSAGRAAANGTVVAEGMRRAIASLAVASTLGLSALVASSTDAFATGGPSGGFVVPTGAVASITNITFSACNRLTWGYQLNGGSNQPQFTFPGGCGAGTASDVTVGPFAAPTSVRIFLTDDHCGATYYSDGTPVDHVIVSGTNPYTLRFADGGGFCERKATTFNNFSGCNFCAGLAIIDQPVQAAGENFTAVEGASASHTVATFADPDTAATAADYSAAIDWGDGSTDSGVITGGPSFTISATHTYSEEGTYSISVTISDVDDPSNTASVTSTANVSDSNLAASPACVASALGAYTGATATFTDAAGSLGTPSDFKSTINWGDGAVTAGTVTASGPGTYTVDGTHGYGSVGAFTIKTTVIDDGGSSAVTSCQTIGFSFAPGGGAFVIGNQHAAMGQSITFWGAQWAKGNFATAGRTPRAFKGFAKSPATPACGVDWSSKPGNSPPPPPGPLPEFMGVIVTNSVSQAGSSVSGSAVLIVVVKTNPGYSPSPGHTGTGTVVAVFCSVH